MTNKYLTRIHRSTYAFIFFPSVGVVFAARCYASSAHAVMRCSFVCPSVCPWRSWILSKRINISSNFFHNRVATPIWFFHTKRHGDIPTGTLKRASNAGLVERNRDSEPIYGFIACCQRCDCQALSTRRRRTVASYIHTYIDYAMNHKNKYCYQGSW